MLNAYVILHPYDQALRWIRLQVTYETERMLTYDVYMLIIPSIRKFKYILPIDHIDPTTYQIPKHE